MLYYPRSSEFNPSGSVLNANDVDFCDLSNLWSTYSVSSTHTGELSKGPSTDKNKRFY